VTTFVKNTHKFTGKYRVVGRAFREHLTTNEAAGHEGKQVVDLNMVLETQVLANDELQAIEFATEVFGQGLVKGCTISDWKVRLVGHCSEGFARSENIRLLPEKSTIVGQTRMGT